MDAKRGGMLCDLIKNILLKGRRISRFRGNPDVTIRMRFTLSVQTGVNLLIEELAEAFMTAPYPKSAM